MRTLIVGQSWLWKTEFDPGGELVLRTWLQQAEPYFANRWGLVKSMAG